MTNILPLITIVIFVFFTICLIHFQRRSLRRKQDKGLHWVELTRNLLANIQKHRGLSTGVLNGDETLIPTINQLQELISKDFNNINSTDVEIIENENWKSILEHWDRLKDRYQHISSENNIEQHTRLIRNILYFIEEIAENYYLLKIPNISSFGYDFMWKDLLETVEFMGQARALGIGVVASGQCSSVDKIKLNYLSDKITEKSIKLWQKIPCKHSSQNSVKELIVCIKETLIPGRSTISTKEYFDLVTTAMDNLYSEFDDAIKKLQSAL